MLRTIHRGISLRAARATTLAALVLGGTLFAMSGTALAAAGSPAVHAAVTLHTRGVFLVGADPVTVPGRAVVVSGDTRPFVPGQRVEVRGYLDGHLFTKRILAVEPFRGDREGTFDTALSAPRAGQVEVVVTHTGNAALGGFERHAAFSALSEDVGPGSTGRFVELLQDRLSALHFYIPLTGVYDEGTELAVDAYHRLLGQGVSQTAGPGLVSELLDGVGSFQVRYPRQGRHAEGDLSDQLVALVNGSHVYWIFPTSSGKPSTPTVEGSFRVYRRTPGYLPDGMYYSDFFYTGYAIHGYNPAPDYPASHGCLRIPIVDAIPAFNWLALGDWVDVYGTPPGQ